MVERAYIVRGSRQLRLQSTFYIVNSFGMMTVFVTICVLLFVFRIGYIDEGGTCIIGMQRPVMVALIIFDMVINVGLMSPTGRENTALTVGRST